MTLHVDPQTAKAYVSVNEYDVVKSSAGNAALELVGLHLHHGMYVKCLAIKNMALLYPLVLLEKDASVETLALSIENTVKGEDISENGL